MFTKQSAKDCIDLLQTELNKSIFSSRYSIKTRVDREWILKDNTNIYRQIKCYVRCQNEEETGELNALSDSIKEKINSNLEKYSLIEDFQILTQLQEGDQLPVYENLTDLYKQTSTEIQHQQGEVILIWMWATWSVPCQSIMQHNQEMLEKNSEKWGDKVRIIAVSVDDERDDVIERVEEKKWDKIIHYILNGWESSHPIMQDFEMDGLPFVAIVDSEGKLNYSGNPSSININFEERISSLFEKKQNDEQPADASDLSSKQYKQAKLLVNIKFSEFQEDSSFEFSFSFQKTKTIKSDSQIKTYNKPSFSSRYNKKQEKGYLEFKDKSFEFLGKDVPLKKEQEILADPKSYLNSDLKSLKAIFEDNSLKTVEIQYLVSFKLTYTNGKFTQSRKDELVQHQKLAITPELTVEKLAAVTKKVKEFVRRRYQSGSYEDYLHQLYQTGIRGQEEKAEINKSDYENHEQEYKKFKVAFDSKAIENIEQILNLNNNIKLKLKVKRHKVFDYQGNIIKKYYDKPSLSYIVRKSDEQAVQLLLNKIFEQVPEANFKVIPKFLDTVKVEVGTSCGICSTELGLPQYYNYFQKQYLCLPCGDKRDTSIKTIKQFTVSDNLIFINSLNPPELNLSYINLEKILNQVKRKKSNSNLVTVAMDVIQMMIQDTYALIVDQVLQQMKDLLIFAKLAFLR